MNELLQQFHFLRPWWLAALLLLPLLGWFGVRRNVAQMELSRLVDAELLPHLLRGRAGNRSLPLWLFALGWILCALALAGPTWSRVEQPLYASRTAQVVAISLSQHMLARDVAPSRLDRARYKARDLLHANQDGLNALIGYAGEAFVVAPLTSDAHSLDDLLAAMAPDTMPVDGDNAAAAIERGVALIQDAKAGVGSLVLITDQADATATAAARKADAAGVRVSVLGVGTPQGGPVPLSDGGFLRDAQGGMLLARRDDTALAALAAAGGGRYVAMGTDQRDVDALHAQLQSTRATLADGQHGDQWQDRGAWLLLPLLPLVALMFRRGWLLALPLIVLPLWPGTASATSWRDLWQRPDQQAAQALRAGDAKRAQQLARDPAWRGAAAYRAGDYAAAAQALPQAPGSDAAYNLGNTLAKQGEYQQALAAYDHALQLDPTNADAKANRQAVEDWLHRQQQPSDQKEHEGHGGKQNQSSQGEQGKSGKQDAKNQSSASKNAEQSGQPGQDGKPQAQDPSGKNESQQGKSEQGDAGQPKPQTAQQQAEQKAQAEQAQQALKQQMDAELAKQGDDKTEHQLGALAKDDPQAKLPADLRHALQRVPDDPGALLRRKFELEYQQRHGGAPSEDQQP
ncbi:colicin transporter [Rhodanobacter thiooxydans]|uniref:Colicin transporter n=1 Tax=Rhodanobacter thiooxydans TaxID=416169 RepID=A0A154QFC1_9GAMM|nr:tetratricopeptide repeat protein [Rhodanobacter thiooxydans]EIM01001.1 membrane protein involved in colicin uptake [Rhodanobacter thiooxydans LCS2]KZC22337.1 colicin transporter [Rhodanobacter thiooxydans]